MGLIMLMFWAVWSWGFNILNPIPLKNITYEETLDTVDQDIGIAYILSDPTVQNIEGIAQKHALRERVNYSAFVRKGCLDWSFNRQTTLCFLLPGCSFDFGASTGWVNKKGPFIGWQIGSYILNKICFFYLECYIIICLLCMQFYQCQESRSRKTLFRGIILLLAIGVWQCLAMKVVSSELKTPHKDRKVTQEQLLQNKALLDDLLKNTEFVGLHNVKFGSSDVMLFFGRGVNSPIDYLRINLDRFNYFFYAPHLTSSDIAEINSSLTCHEIGDGLFFCRSQYGVILKWWNITRIVTIILGCGMIFLILKKMRRKRKNELVKTE